MKTNVAGKCSAIALSIVGLVACSEIQEPPRERDAPLQTDRLSYSLTTQGDILTTPPIELEFTNTSGTPVFFLVRGNGEVAVAVQRLENGEWQLRYQRNLPNVISAAIRLEPGEKTTFETMIEGFLPGTCECHPIVDLADGIYRFRLEDVVDSYDAELGVSSQQLPLEFRVSNQFALDAP